MNSINEIKVAFIGNPNCGKTTIFNTLTGAKQHTGNWPGVTVEHKEGVIITNDMIYKIIDLPGLYSLSSYSYEEKVTKNYITSEDIDIIVNIVDASVLERNLYLTTQLIEFQIPMIIAFNMTDMVDDNNISINYPHIANMLGVKYVTCVGSKDNNLDNILDTIKIAVEEKTPPRQMKYSHELETEILKLKDQIKTKNENLFIKNELANIPLRWFILKSLEGNKEEIDILKANVIHGQSAYEKIVATRKHIEDIYKEHIQEIITDDRYGFVEGVIKDAVVYPNVHDEQSLTEKIDNIFLNRLLGIPLFLIIMYLMFTITFKIGDLASGYISLGIDYISSILKDTITNPMLESLTVNGIINGVGGVLLFIPTIAVMFIAISILEDSGYLSRAAFLSDKAMHSMGLHGKSFISLLLGFGCNVPAIMAARTLDSRADKIVTCLINPLMSCSARLPIYVLFTSVFFAPNYKALVIFSIYAWGVLLAVILGKIFRRTLFKDDESPFVMELPTYRMPTIKGTSIHVWERTKEFIIRAGTIIVLVSMVVWFLSYFPSNAEFASKNSYIGQAGIAIEPILKPIGLDGNAGISLIFGIGAKEIVVSTLNIILGSNGNITETLKNYYTPLTAYVFMIFCLIYMPCAATIITLKREIVSWKFTIIGIIYPLILAWLIGFLIYNIGHIIGFK